MKKAILNQILPGWLCVISLVPVACLLLFMNCEVFADGLSANQIQEIHKLLDTTEDQAQRNKLTVLLINDAVGRQNGAEELGYRQNLFDELTGKEAFIQQHSANLYHLGVLAHSSGATAEAFQRFEQLLAIVPRSKIRLRNLTLQYLSRLAAQLNRIELEEKYLALYVVAVAKTSDFHETATGYEMLLELTAKTKSNRAHYYFENWFEGARRNGTKVHQKKVLTRWVNYAAMEPENFSDKPFELLMGFFKAEMAWKELRALQHLYAQNTPDENKKIGVYEGIFSHNRKMAQPTDLPVLTLLYSAYRTDKQQQKELQILKILAAREDYPDRGEALKRLARISLEREDWTVSSDTHLELLEMTPPATHQEGVVVLDNLIVIYGKLLRDDLTVRYLQQKALIPSSFISDKARFEAFTRALKLQIHQQEFDAANQFYLEMVDAPFLEQPHPDLYEIHLWGASVAEEKGDYAGASALYQLSLDTLMKQDNTAAQNPNGQETALKIAQKLLLLTESRFPGKKEIPILQQISEIYRQQENLEGQAKTEHIIAQKLSKLGEKEKAVSYYNEAVKNYRKSGNIEAAGQVLKLLTNLEEGASGNRLQRLLDLENVQEASSNTKELVSTRTEIGNYYKTQGETAAAVDYYLKAAKTAEAQTNMDSARAAYYAGLLLSQNHELERANLVYISALGNNGLEAADPAFTGQIHQAYAKNLDQQNKIPEALQQIEHALQKHKQVTDSKSKLLSSLVYTKASIQLNDNRYPAAEKTVQDYLQSATGDPETVGLLIVLARAQLGTRNIPAALENLEKALTRHGDVFSEDLYDILMLKSDGLNLKRDLITAVKNQQHLIKQIEQSNQKEKLGQANLKLAGYYARLGRLSDALAANRQAGHWIKDGSDDQLRLLLNAARIYREQGEIERSLEIFARLQALITATSPVELAAETAYQRGYTRLQASRLDQALEDFRESEKLYRQTERRNAVILSQKAQASVLSSLGKIAEAEAIYLALLEKVKDNPDLKGDINNALAFLYSETGQYDKALDYSRTAENAWQETQQKQRIPEVLNTRGLIYLKMNDFDQAEISFKRAMTRNAPFENPLLDSEITNNLGGLYRANGELEKARVQLLKTAELQKKLGLESMTALTSNNIGSVLLEENRFSEALTFFRQARVVAEKYKLSRELAVSWSNEGILFFKQQKLAEAEKAFKEAVKPQQALELKIDLARSFNNLSIIAAQQQRLDEALESVQKAVMLISLQQPAEAGEFPNPELNSVLAPNLMKDFLQNKGDILREMADRDQEKDKTVGYLVGSYQSLALAAELIESLRSGIKSEASQKRLIRNNIEVFQKLINILFELGNRAPGKGYHEKAFYYAEMSRARSFLDQLQEQTARAALKLPPEIRDREKQLKDKIAFLDREIFVELNKPQSERDISKIEREQLNKTEASLEFKRFTTELEQTFPAYAELKFPKVYDVKTTQQELVQADTLLIAYFIGTDVSYGWTVGRTSFSMVALAPETDVSQLVRRYRKTLVNPLISEDAEDEELIVDSTRSHIAVGLQIQRSILKPLLKLAGKEVTQLIVVPDGALYYLPFETVLTGIHFQTGNRFPKGREYMLHRFAIRYSPSVSVLGRMRTQVQNRDKASAALRKNFIGFGDPEYKPEKSVAKNFKYNQTLRQQGFYSLDRLFNTKKELDEISAVFDEPSTVYLREDARESTVKKSLSGYKYIHFATHGILDERNPEFSGVVMNLIQGDSPEDGFLQASEIFDLKINSDLVVLSACETGLGKVIKGEGMVGLTRAFLFAGTPSIVVSLWTVADESTSKLMIYFYEFLNKGHSKDDALRKARLKLLNEKDDSELIYADPFYWGPFILNGTQI